jgi:carbonic anhydrase/acetyltransferase-like protein (isoleucine patch superfamily)
MTLYALEGLTPQTPEDGDYWVAPDANVIGNVVLETATSIWFGSTLRGDNERITIGAGSNVQENTVMHTDMGFPLIVGAGCTIGHKAMLHGCVLGENTLIGMGATVLNGARIGRDCLIGAGALIPENKEIPDGSLVVGAPGRVIRQLDAAAIEGLRKSALHYQQRMRLFRDGLTAV